MKVTIGNQELDIQVVSEGTYRTKNKNTILRELTVSFTVQGRNASDQYNRLARTATKNCLTSRDSQSVITWELYDETGTTWEGQDDYMVYTCLWILREKEDS
jgi:hypothetical protein